MSTATSITNIANELPVITAALQASGIPQLAAVATIGQLLEGIVSSLQAASQAERELAGITDPAELDAAVGALLAQAEALNAASHGT